jgi:hypothetical protein
VATKGEVMAGVDNDDHGLQAPKELTAKGSWNWQEHLPLLVAFLSILFISLRLLSVSNQNIETAEGILQASGTATVVIGALIPAMGLVTLALTAVAVNLLVFGAIDDSLRPLAVALAGIFLLASFFTTPIFFLFMLALGVAVNLKLRSSMPSHPKRSKFEMWLRSRVNPDNVKERWSVYYLMGAIVLLFVFLATSSTPWLPAETITFSNKHQLTGYVLGETTNDLAVLTYRTRRIVDITPNSIISRAICSESGAIYNGFFYETLPTLIAQHNTSNYPACRN